MILILSSSKKIASEISDSFIMAGYLAKGTTFSHALRDFSSLHRAILVDDIFGKAPCKDFLNTLNKSPRKVPIIFLSEVIDERPANKISHSFEGETINKLLDFLNSGEKRIKGKYVCAGFDCSARLDDVYYFDEKLNFTKTQKRILAYLCLTYSTPQTAKAIIKHAFTSSHAVKESTVRAHVSLMNKAFMSLRGRKIVEFLPKKGYIINTPEIKNVFIK